MPARQFLDNFFFAFDNPIFLPAFDIFTVKTLQFDFDDLLAVSFCVVTIAWYVNKVLAASLYCYRNCTLCWITCLKTFLHTWMAAMLVFFCAFFLALKVFWMHVARNHCFVSTW